MEIRTLGPNKYDPIVEILTSQGYAIKGLGKKQFKSESDMFWAVVHQILQFLYEKYPFEMKAIEAVCAIQREGLDGDFAEMKSGDDSPLRRKLFKLPTRLDRAITLAYGESGYPMLKKDFMRGFWKKYPQFRIAKKY